MNHLNRSRFALAMLSLLGLLAAGALAFFYGADLNGTQISLLTLIVTSLATKVAAAFSWFFDGIPDKPPAPSDPPKP